MKLDDLESQCLIERVEPNLGNVKRALKRALKRAQRGLQREFLESLKRKREIYSKDKALKSSSFLYHKKGHR